VFFDNLIKIQMSDPNTALSGGDRGAGVKGKEREAGDWKYYTESGREDTRSGPWKP
jgi:hypothetical protein